MRFQLLSPGYFGLAISAIVLLPVLSGRVRQFAFLALNVVFLWALLLGPAGALSTILYATLGYGLAHLAMRRSRSALVIGLSLYVALFVYLRRYDFVDWVLPDALLPRLITTIGLSFLFFKAVHVVIDAYGGTIGRLDFLTYLNYCLNFATFMMGPIQRFQDYRDQWQGVKPAIPQRYEAHLDAALRVLVGLAKAYILAPLVEPHALAADTRLHELSFTGLAVQSYAFWLFLYLNFSGYCDVAIGVGSLFGVRAPENFDRPFLARNISDFWQRQHRSLTLWLTDYVFSPLYKKLLTTPVTARHKLLAANVSLVTTMLISGLWHGTTVSFLLFGLVHGLFFVIYRSWDQFLQGRLGREGVRRFRRNVLVHATGIVLTVSATAFAFVFFRVTPDSLTQTLRVIVLQ